MDCVFIAKHGSNTPLLAMLKLVKSFVDTPIACGRVVYSGLRIRL
jgi:hypothetical protein